MENLNCDCCGRKIDTSDERVAAHLRRTYPFESICADCDLLVVLAKETVLKDIIESRPPGTTVGIMFDNYD